MNYLYAICGLSKQGHFDAVRREKEQVAKEPFYIGFIEDIRAIHPGMGLRKMYKQFEPDGIGRDAFIALGLYYGYRLKAVKTHHRTTYSIKNTRYRNLLVDKRFTDINQLWVSDLFYFPIKGEHYYIVLIMDVYSRLIIGYSVSDNMRAENNISALNMALTLRGVDKYNNQLIHHSDRGSQYVSNNYTDLLEDYEIQISMCTDVLENAHCERANGTIKNEYLNRWDIKNFYQLKKNTDRAIRNYNNRLHDSIKMTPNEFEIFITELKPSEKTVMKIFTLNRNFDNPLQLSLGLDL